MHSVFTVRQNKITSSTRSAGTVHTSAKARLTSVAIQIWITTKI